MSPAKKKPAPKRQRKTALASRRKRSKDPVQKGGWIKKTPPAASVAVGAAGAGTAAAAANMHGRTPPRRRGGTNPSTPKRRDLRRTPTRKELADRPSPEKDSSSDSDSDSSDDFISPLGRPAPPVAPRKSRRAPTGSEIPWSDFKGLNPQQLGEKMAEVVVSEFGSPSKLQLAMDSFHAFIKAAVPPVVGEAITPVETAPKKKAARGTPLFDYNADAYFESKRHPGELIPPDSARQAKYRSTKQLGEVISSCGNPAQQAVAITHVLQKKKFHSVGVAVGVVSAKEQENRAVADQMFNNVKESLHLEAVHGKNTNKALTYRDTVAWTVVPAAPANTATIEARKLHVKNLMRMHRALGLTSKGSKKAFQKASVLRRDNLLSKDPDLVPAFLKGKDSRYTVDWVIFIVNWVMFKCSKVTASPNAKDTVIVKDLRTGKKSRQRKMFYTFSVREIHNEMILPVEQGGMPGARDQDGTVLISDTMLRAILPKSLSRMSESNKAMCGCETCLNARSMIMSLNSFRRRVRKQLVGIRASCPEGSPERVVANEVLERFVQETFQDEVPFTDMRKPMWNRCDDAILQMSCPAKDAPVGESKLVSLKCALERCDKCPKLPPVHNERFCGPATEAFRCIPWSQYENHLKCKMHGAIPDGKECLTCKNLPEKLKSKKAVKKELELAKKLAPIGDFISKYWVPFLNKLRYHLFWVIVLSKLHCVKQRDERFFKTPTGRSVLIHRDYSDRLASSYDGEAQSQGMGDRPNTGMEGITVKYYKDGKYLDGEELQMDWHCFLQDLKRQDARTSHNNTSILIEKLQANPFNLLPKEKDAVMYEQADGCSKQYKSGTALWSMSFLSRKYKIVINRMVTAPGHGKGTVDALAGFDKWFIRKHFCAVKGVGDNDTVNKLESYTVDENGKTVSFAKRCADLLSDRDRVFGAKGHRKSQKRENIAKTRERFYYYMNYEHDGPDKVEVPLPTTGFKAKGFDEPTYIDPETGKKKKYGKSGIKDHFHFYCHYDMPKDTVAVRRVPCSCQSCHDQITKPWVKDLDWKKQPRFKLPANCELKDQVEGLNHWKFITLAEDSNNFDQDEVDDCYDKTIADVELEMSLGIKKGKYGAYNCEKDPKAPEGYYVVKWTGEPFALEEPATVEGFPAGKMDVGTVVCEGQYMYRVMGAPLWYQTLQSAKEDKGMRGYDQEKRLFRVQFVLDPDIAVENHRKKGRNMNCIAQRHLTPFQWQMSDSWCKKVPEVVDDELQEEKKRRDAMQYVECCFENAPGDQYDDSDSDSDDDEDEYN